jgi:hypothetical protein
MKKILLIVLGVYVMTFMACGNNNESVVSEATITTEETTTMAESITESETNEEVSKESEDALTSAEKEEVEGVIEDAARSTVVIVTSLGERLEFFIEGADMSEAGDFEIGSKVSIEYEGDKAIKISEVK